VSRGPTTTLRAARLLALFAALLTAASPGRAVAADPPPLSQSLRGDAAAAYKAGRILFDDGDFAGALSKWRDAFELSKDPRLLFNMAACEKSLRHYHRAQALLQRYLETGGSLVTTESRRQVQETLSAITSFVGSLTLRVAPADAAVFVDGEKVDATAPVALDLGKHALRAEKDGYAPYAQEFEVRGGVAAELSIELTPVRTSAHLLVETDAAATVSVDDHAVARGGFDGEVSPGVHVLRVTEAGRKTYETQLELTAGSRRELTVNLEGVARPVVWPWLVGGGAVIVAAGAVGGYFLFKPKEQPGSVPVGQLGTVTISAVR
jgi:hypothetical protein